MAKDNKEMGTEAPKNSSEQKHHTQSTEHTSEHREYSQGAQRQHRAGEAMGNRFSIENLGESREAQSLVASAALIGVGALIEPELLGGMLLGAGIAYASRTLPIVGSVLRPVMKTMIRVGYAATAKASEVIAEATEEMQDMVAEARSDYHGHMPPPESH